MTTNDSPSAPAPFGKEHAEKYDTAFTKLLAFKDTLHIGTRCALAALPDNAHILCAGAGTGAEILYLADAFPGWQFTAVDLSAPMLEVCQRRVGEAGIAARVATHIGPVSSLDATTPFTAATSLLVSQFIQDRDTRCAFFADIAARLAPGAPLVSADLMCDLESPASPAALDHWRNTLAFAADRAPDEMDAALAALGRAVFPLGEKAYTALLRDAGFEQPTRFFQAGLMQGWFARTRSPG